VVSQDPIANWIRRVLTRREMKPRGRTRKLECVEIPPSENIVCWVEFCFVALTVLTAIEIVHIVFLGKFNDAVFSAISSLIGMISGIFMTR